MKKLTETYIRKLPPMPALREPKPFPGKYPTKVAYFAAGKLLYLGKPNRVEAMKYSRLRGAKSEVEIDRGGAIRAARYNDAGAFESMVANKLVFYYHPWTKVPAAGRLAEFERPFFMKRAKNLFSGKTQVVYSPFALPRATAFDTHRAWVAKVNWNVA